MVEIFRDYMADYHRPPPLHLRVWLRRLIRYRPQARIYPPWLNSTFAAKLDLPSLWAAVEAKRRPLHPTHAEAYFLLRSSSWPNLFEVSDPGTRGLGLELRHPFFDVRLVTYLLAIPPVPWCVNKRILRDAMAELLPEPIRRRPKTPLAGNLMRALLMDKDLAWFRRTHGTLYAKLHRHR